MRYQSTAVAGQLSTKGWTLEERFWSKVVCDTHSHCWLWTGGTFMKTGYGRIQINGKGALAHRVAYKLTRGQIPPELCVCHSCDVRLCCNPQHFWLGTLTENIEDRDQKGRTASGERNGARLHPDKLARGDRSYAHMHPESRAGERNGYSKLTDTLVRQIRQQHKNGASTRNIARTLNIGLTTIKDVVAKRRWSHVSEIAATLDTVTIHVP